MSHQNWNPNNNAPVNDGTANLVFAGTTRLTPDSDGDWNINSITFSSTAGAFTLSGGTLTLQGTAVAAAILNEDLDTQTINHALVLGATQTWRTNAGALVFGSTVSLGAYTLTMDGSGSIFANGVISGTGGLVKTGTGTLTLSGANTYSGGTTVSAGTLQGSATSLQGNITNNAALVFDQASGGTYAGVVSGTGTLTKQGAGTLTLSGANTYSGNTTVSAGTLALGGNNALSSASALSLASGTTLSLGGSYSTLVGTLSYDNAILDYGTPGSANAFLFNQAGTGTGILTVNNWESGTDVLAFAAGNTPGTSFIENIYFSGIGSGTLGATGQTVAGYGGTWDFITANAGTFFTWDGGGANNSFNTAANWATNVAPTSGTSTKIAMAGNTRLTPNLNVDFTLNSLKFDSTAGSFSFTASAGREFTFDGVVPSIIQASANAQTVNVPLILNKTTFVETTGAGNLTLSGIISGTGGLTKLGTGGSLVLSGANTYAGATSISEGTVVARNSAALGATTGGTSVATGAVLELQNSISIGAEALTLAGTLRSNSGTNTYGGTISGSGAVSVGGGTLTLSGTAANTFTGGATVNAGSLILAKTAGINALAGPVTIGDGSGAASSAIVQLTNANQIGDTAAVTLLADGRLNLNNQSDTIGSLATAAAAANVQLGSGTLTTGGDNTSTAFAGVIAGTGGFTKAGTGTLTLSGTNTYTGATNINGGTLALGASNVLASATNLTIGSGATLDLGGTYSNRVGSLSFNDGNLDFGTDGTANHFLFSDDGTATGTLTIRNWNSTTDILGVATNAIDQLFLDSTFFAGIGVGIGAELSASTQAVGSYGNFYVIRPIETFTWDGGNTSGNVADQDNWSKGGNWAGNVAPATSAGKAIVMAGIVKTANDMDGAYTVHSLLFNSDAGAFTISSSTGDTLTIRGGGLYNQSTATQTLSVPIALAASQVWNAAEGDLVINGSSILNNTHELTLTGAQDITINAAIESGSGAITKTGTGTLTLAGANTYTGATTVSEGTLVATHSSALGSTAAGTSVAAGAVLELQNNASIGAEALALTGTLRSNSGANTYGGAISGTGTVTVGGGSLTLAGTAANTYTGATTVSDGSLLLAKTAGIDAVSGPLTIGDGTGSASTAVVQLTNANQIADTAAVTLLADGRLNLNGQNETIGALGSAAAAANIQLGAGTLTTGGANTSTSFAGVIAGTGGLTKTGTGTFTISGANTYTGATTVSQGTLLLGGAGVLADSSAVTVASAGVLDLNNQTETVGSIAGAGAILIGTGQLITGADNTSTAYTGTLTGDSTAILAKNGSGTLTFGGDFNAGAADFAGTINLNAGGLAFDVDNAFTGTLNVFAGTTLKLSDADLTVANLNFTGAGTITLDFSGTSTLSVEHLTIAAGITVNVINWTDATDYFFAQNWAGAVTDLRGASPMNQVVFASFSASQTQWQSYDNQVTPVPEPSTYGALLIGAVGALLGWRRWRQRRTTVSGKR